MRRRKFILPTAHIPDLIKILGHLEDDLNLARDTIAALKARHELPLVLEDINQLSAKKKLPAITTQWLQRRYDIGYAHARALIDMLPKSIAAKPAHPRG